MRCIVVLLVLSVLGGCGQRRGPSGEARDRDAGSDDPFVDRVDVLIGERAAGKRLASVGQGIERARNLCLMINAPYQSWAGEGTYVHITAFSPSFEPAAGGEVYLGKSLIGRTDENGTFVFRRRPTSEDDEAQGDLTIRWQGNMGSIRYRSNSRTSSFEAPVIFVYTDRGYYNPGQTIHVRALAWRLRGDYEPLRDQEVRLELIDAQDRVVGGGLLHTDEWGVATAELHLPRHAREGRYTLAASNGTERAEGEVRIERFVAPDIEIHHDLGRFLTPQVKQLDVAVTLGYFDGGQFEKGHLTLSAKIGDDEVFLETHEVEGAGPHHVALEALLTKVHERAKVGGDDVEVALTARDEEGREDTVRRRLRYVTNPYKAVIELDRTSYAPGDTVEAMLRLVDLDDVPIRDKQVTLTAPNRQPTKRSTDEGGVARFAFVLATGGQGERWVEASLPEVEGAVARVHITVRDQLPMVSSIEEPVVRERAEVPVLVRFPARGMVPRERVVHADVTDSSGSIIHSFLVPVSVEDGRQVARGTFLAPSWGSMLLNLYCLGSSGEDVGLMASGQNLVVHPGRELEVLLGGVPERAEPGAAFSVDVLVRRPDGEVLDTVLGVSVVDVSVLSMLDPLERSPVDRFYNPERKVLASTGAQTLTWPVVSRNWGPDRHDIGWPPHFGFHTGLTPGRFGKAVFVGCGDVAQAEEEEDAVEQQAAPAPPTTTAPGGAEDARGRDGGPGKGEPRLVLRTDFSETSLWLPRVKAPQGKGRVDVELPDSITVQRVTVVASDQQGGIGVGTKEVPVRQELHVRVGMPAALMETDQVEVPVIIRNLSAEPDEVQVSLTAPDLWVSKGTQIATVEPDGTAVVWVGVRGKAPGEVTYEVSARGKRLHDVERRTMFIRPRGNPGVEAFRGEVSAGAPFAASFRLTTDDRYHVARVGVSLPTVVPGLQGLLYLTDLPDEGIAHLGIDPAVSRVLATTAAYRYLGARDQLTSDRRAELRGWLTDATVSLLMSQNPDGGWGWFWDRASNPFITAYALHALLELRDLDFPVPIPALRTASDYLAGAMGDDGLYDMAAIAVWEGESDDVRLVGTAEIFDVLSRVPADARTDAYRTAMRSMAERFRAYLEAPSPDPLALAHAVGGLHQVGEDLGFRYLEPEVRTAARRLARIRREVHWEPGWFQAYGGTIEATAVALEVMHDLDPEGFEAARADAAQFIQSTQRSWGAWHNARSTAYGVRALLLLDPTGEGARGGALTVRADDVEVARIDVDPEDPYGSALALREIELEGLEPGNHEVVVIYEGAPAARATIEVERWSYSPNTVPLRSERDGAGLLLSRLVPNEMHAGEPVDIELTLESSGPVGPVVVEQLLPPTISVDRGSLEALVRAETLAGYEITDTSLVMSFQPGGTRTATYRLVGARPGRVTFAPATASAVLRPDLRAHSQTSMIVVR